MNDYVEVRFDLVPCEDYMTDLLAAILADEGYESFVPDVAGLTAYIKEDDYKADLSDLIDSLPFDAVCEYRAKRIEGHDWNSEWEKNYFQPVIVGGECVVHSTFHKDIPKCRYDIVIDPKMAFGTGHHSTTSLMISRLLAMELDGKSVIDMGTGTGILAILAAMCGATPVTGVEIDGFAYANALENIALNGHSEIAVLNGDVAILDDIQYKTQLFIANINRNVITGDMAEYAASLAPGGVMLLSGFYVDDIPEVRQAAEKAGLIYDDYTENNNWACVKLHKP